METKIQVDSMVATQSQNTQALDRMLSAWSADPRIVDARAVVDSEITAVELRQRITKIRAR